jgi:EmrB/QacA subfamily drug resistance transporter
VQEQPNTGDPRRWAILAVLVVSLVVVVLDNTVLNVALRIISDPVRGIGASQEDLEWALNSYTLVFAGLLFTLGVLGDRIGRRRMLLIGLAVFGLSSLGSAYSQSPTQLIYARALMGIGAAAIMPATLSIIAAVFDPRERGRAIGVWAGSVGLGVAIGPVVGGLLLETFWWGSVFLLNVPIVAAGIVAVLVIVPESRDPHPGRVDLIGVGLTIVGLIAFVYGIIYGGQHTFGHVLSYGGILLGVAVIATFVWYEAHSDHPSLDVRLFRNPRFSASIGAVGLVFFAALGTLFFLSFYLQLVRGYSPLVSGLLLTPFAAAQLIFAPLSSSMVRRFGNKAVGTVGLALVAAGLLGFSLLTESSPIALLALYFFIQGAGMANVLPPATESIMASVPRDRAGVGSAIQNTVRQVGGALGVAILGSLIASRYRAHVDPALSGLPAGIQDAASTSIAAAYAVAPAAGLQAGRITAAANDAFVTAMHWAATTSAIIALLGALVVLIWVPRRVATMPPPPRPPEPEPAPAPVPVPGRKSGEPVQNRGPDRTPRDGSGVPPAGDRVRWPANVDRLVSDRVPTADLASGRKLTLR